MALMDYVENKMSLKKTYYDALRVIRPYLIRHIHNDVVKLHTQGILSPVMSADDFDSSTPRIIDDIGRDLKQKICAATGVPPSTVPDDIQDLKDVLGPDQITNLKALLRTVNFEYHAFLNFELFGKRTFLIADHLVEDLAQTSVNVKCGLLHLPFASCMLVFTSPIAINALFLSLGRTIDDLTVNYPDITYDIPVSVVVTLGDPNHRFPHRRLIVSAFQGDEARQTAMTNRQLYLDDAWSIEQSLRTDWDAVHARYGIGNEDSQITGRSTNVDASGVQETPVNDETFYTDGLLFFRLVLNAILYITSTDADLTDTRGAADEFGSQANDRRLNSAERRKLRRLRSMLSDLPYCEVGFRLRPIIIKQTPVDQDGPYSALSGRKVNVRFKVRGHWRAQRCGPGRKDVRPTWVRDHEKGPDLAEAVNRHYVVE